MDASNLINNLRQQLRGKGETVIKPQEIDEILQGLYDLNTHEHLLSRLADHYNVNYKEFRDLLISRQVLYLHLLTDYAKAGSPALLQSILKQQHAKIADTLEQSETHYSQLLEVIRQAELIQDEAVRILAIYKATYLKDKALE